MRKGSAMRIPARLPVCCVLVVVFAAASSGAEGFRNIAAVTLDTYFDTTWRLETSDVFLARVIPALTIQARLTRDDSEGWNQHTVFLGPVVSFSRTFYLDSGYGLSVDSAGLLTHEAEANFNYETAETSASAGLRGNWFPDTRYGYLLPSVSAQFHLMPPLALFGKFFLSVDTDSVVTESFWGEAQYRFSPFIAARGGMTVSRASGFGWSILAGVDVTFSPAVTLRYTAQYLSATVEYLSSAPRQQDGVENGLILDVSF